MTAEVRKCPVHGTEHDYPSPHVDDKPAPGGVCQVCWFRHGRFMPLSASNNQSNQGKK